MSEKVENNCIKDVTIEVGQMIYGRLQDMKNDCSHVLAEFVDNALQSYIDHKQELKSLEPNYKLMIKIDFWWGDSSITVKDNAGGIDWKHFANAFKLANTPKDTSGLNEFGMGMKTAALWLGKTWELTTTALGEPVKRSVVFNLDDVQESQLKFLPVKEEPVEENEHYTSIEISNLTANAPTQKALEKIKNNLASVYRKQLISGDMILIVNGDELSYEYPEILVAPEAKNPSGTPIKWKKDIDFKFRKYSAKGFIAILKEIKATNNGIVLLRRGRVIMGDGPENRYFPKSICGSSGNFRYKRIFGELEIEGFKVTFNKNGVAESEDLDALMEALKSEIHQKNFDLYAQAEDYRVDTNTKLIKRLIKIHDKRASGVKRTTFVVEDDNPVFQPVQPKPIDVEPINHGEYEDSFKANGQDYTMRVKFISSPDEELLWIDTKELKDRILNCMVNTSHPFFEVFFKDKFDEASPSIAIMRALAIAKYTAQSENKGIDKMFAYFNKIIRQIKV